MSGWFGLSLGLICLCNAAIFRETLVIDEWVVNFLRPTTELSGLAKRRTPYQMDDDIKKAAFLVNGTYPGPTLRMYENDTVEILVINQLLSESVTIHWHGIHPRVRPYMDGAKGITQSPVIPGGNMTYKWTAWPPGTHYYHSHMDAAQTSRGLKGALVVMRKEDPWASMYTEEQVVVLSDEWRDPSVCLKNEGAMPGSPVCTDLRHASFNGQYGNGSLHYPYPLISVKPDTCYRLRFIMMAGVAENFIVTVAGHNLTMVALDSYDIKPLMVTSFNLHLGERVDVILCADQAPGNYVVNGTYDYACSLMPGNFIPPGLSVVPDCHHYAMLHYEGHNEVVTEYPPQAGTGGGKDPKRPSGVDFDLTHAQDWHKATPFYDSPPYYPDNEPADPDYRITIHMGLVGPTYNDVTNEPLTKGRWYMDLEEMDPPRPWVMPTTPVYKSKGKYGMEDIPFITIPESANVVEIVINNLSPAAHMVHMHGMPFKVINNADFAWCALNRTSCFVMPWQVGGGCPKENIRIGDPNRPEIEGGTFWGCVYNASTDRKSQNLETPLLKDMIQVWQRSWSVIRFRADNPGMWMFHCHMEDHIPLGMQMVLNVLESKQPPAEGVPEASRHWQDNECPASDEVAALRSENARLRRQLADSAMRT